MLRNITIFNKRMYQSVTGFTLLEVLIAAALIGLIVVTAVAINTSADFFFRKSTGQSGVQDEAAIIMEQILRDIRRGYDIDVYPTAIRIYVNERDSTTYTGNYVKYYRVGNILRFYPESPSSSFGNTGYQIISTKINTLTIQAIPSPANRINILVNMITEDQGETADLESTATLLYRPTEYPWE